MHLHQHAGLCPPQSQPLTLSQLLHSTKAHKLLQVAAVPTASEQQSLQDTRQACLLLLVLMLSCNQASELIDKPLHCTSLPQLELIFPAATTSNNSQLDRLIKPRPVHMVCRHCRQHRQQSCSIVIICRGTCCAIVISCRALLTPAAVLPALAAASKGQEGLCCSCSGGC